MTCLSTRATETLREAKVLRDACTAEGAISRAPYVVFHAMRAVLETKAGLATRDMKCHHGLKRLFDEHVVKAGLMPHDFSVIVAGSTQARWDADYGPTEDDEPLLVQAILDDAKRFVGACAALLEPGP